MACSPAVDQSLLSPPSDSPTTPAAPLQAPTTGADSTNRDAPSSPPQAQAGDTWQADTLPPADAWDAALHVEELHISRGREEGLREGAERGFQDGMQQGLRQGVELGQELGWYWGCSLVWQSLVEALRADVEATSASPAVSDRARRSLMQLQSLIRSFPIREALRDEKQAEAGASDASMEEHLQAVRAKFVSTASAFGAPPKRPLFLRQQISLGTPKGACAPSSASLDF